MGKEKVLSVRLNPDQFDNLHELTQTMDLKKSKFVRNLISKQLKAAESGKEVVNVKIKPNHYNTLTNLAEKSNMKTDKYLRKLVKENLESPGGRGGVLGGGISNEKYKDLENDLNEMSNLYQEMSTKYHELENTVETLTEVKNDLMKELIFAKKGSKVLIKLFENAMGNSEIMGEIRELLTDTSGRPSNDYSMIMELKKLLEEEA